MRRQFWARALLLAVIGAALGWLGGLVWFSVTGSPSGDFGSSGEGLAEVARGITAGALTGILAGVSWDRPAGRARWITFTGGAAVAVLFVVGVSYIGDWTNADGPGWRGWVGILGIPAAIALLAILLKETRE